MVPHRALALHPPSHAAVVGGVCVCVVCIISMYNHSPSGFPLIFAALLPNLLQQDLCGTIIFKTSLGSVRMGECGFLPSLLTAFPPHFSSHWPFIPATAVLFASPPPPPSHPFCNQSCQAVLGVCHSSKKWWEKNVKRQKRALKQL